MHLYGGRTTNTQTKRERERERERINAFNMAVFVFHQKGTELFFQAICFTPKFDVHDKDAAVVDIIAFHS